MTLAISSLPTLIVSAADSRGDTLRTCLLEAGCTIVAEVRADSTLAAQIAQHQPGLIVLNAASAAGKLASTVALACGEERFPLAVFTSDGSDASIDAALTAGASAYVIDGVEPARVRAVLGVALARFRQQGKLLDELSGARTKLAERNVIDRAKGILMARHKLGEDEAYALMRKAAMDQGKKLAEVAQALVTAAELLK